VYQESDWNPERGYRLEHDEDAFPLRSNYLNGPIYGLQIAFKYNPDDIQDICNEYNDPNTFKVSYNNINNINKKKKKNIRQVRTKITTSIVLVIHKTRSRSFLIKNNT
jgi:hypothetical protein